MAGVVSSIIGGGPGQIAAFSTYYMGASAQPAFRDTRRYRGEVAVTAAGWMESITIDANAPRDPRGEVTTMTRGGINRLEGERFFSRMSKVAVDKRVNPPGLMRFSMDIWNVSVIYFAALTRCPKSDVEISRAICTRCNSRSCNLELRAGLKLKFDINARVFVIFGTRIPGFQRVGKETMEIGRNFLIVELVRSVRCIVCVLFVE